jgi:dolichol-phosphate mannosyltransferase
MIASKTLLFIPTYNERENVGIIYQQIKQLNLDLNLLFIDDGSPDGTGMILDQLAKQDPCVSVIHRSGKLGIGSAHQHAIDWAYQQGYSILISMDCDLTHPPERIPDLIVGSKDAQVVVGSRFMQVESLADWNIYRKFLTHLGHFLTRHLLHVSYDASGAFRLYRLDTINPKLFKLVESRGYSFFFESLYVLCLSNTRIAEIPITLPKRTYGHSKMKISDIVASVRRLFALYFRSFGYKTRIRALAKSSPDVAQQP